MTHRLLGAVVLWLSAAAAGADPAFLAQASGLLDAGKADEAWALAQSVLTQSPNDADALVVAGTSLLYQKMEPVDDESIFHPQADPAVESEYRLTPEGARSVAAYWKRVPGLDPQRSYLWGDLAELTFRAGDPSGALDYARQLLALPGSDGLRVAALVFVLNLDWKDAIDAYSRMGSRAVLLYRGLTLWKDSQDGWREPLKAFASQPGPDASGAGLAAYVAGPDMRDTETGYQEALKRETTAAGLLIRQKYVERYPNRFLAQLDFARALSEYGSFDKALGQLALIDRQALASTDDERLTVQFQRAWALQSLGRYDEADRVWQDLADTKEFYIRSAADWFVGKNAKRKGHLPDAKEAWAKIAGEPLRSKYAFWAARELKSLAP